MPTCTSLGTNDVISLVKQDGKSFHSPTCDIHVKNMGQREKIAKGMKVSKKKKNSGNASGGSDTLIFGFTQVDKGQTSTVKEDNERALPLLSVFTLTKRWHSKTSALKISLVNW